MNNEATPTVPTTHPAAPAPDPSLPPLFHVVELTQPADPADAVPCAVLTATAVGAEAALRQQDEAWAARRAPYAVVQVGVAWPDSLHVDSGVFGW